MSERKTGEKTENRLDSVSVIGFLLVLSVVNFAESALIRTPPDAAVCSEENVTLSWEYDNTNDVSIVIWFKDGAGFMFKIGSNDAQLSIPPIITNVENIQNGEIKLLSVTTANNGLYKIAVTYPGATAVDEVQVTVKDPPSVPTFRSTTVGQQTIVFCEAVNIGTPAVEVRIKIGGILQASSSSVVDFTKPIDCCVVGEASTCIPGNTNKLSEYCKNVITPSGPDNIQLSPNTTTYTLNVGETFGPVVCSATCVPTCTFRWTENTLTISNSATLSRIIQDKNDRGNYACTATRAGTSVTESRSISVYVRYGPESASFNPAGPTFTKSENSSLTIHCTSECFPGCAYSWKKQKETQTVTTSSTLLFNPLKRDNATEYICTVSNTNSWMTAMATATATVVVRYGPNSVSFSPAGPLIKNEGDQLTVRCISSCYPGCSYIWTKHGQSGSISTYHTLYFSGVQRNHAGNYKCTVRNTYSGITATQSGAVTLSVRCKYDMANLSTE